MSNPSTPPNSSPTKICETCPECKVEVGSFFVHPSVFDTGGSHLFIRYTKRDGSMWYYRGGPSTGSEFSEDPNATEANAQNSEPNPEVRTGEQKDEPSSVPEVMMPDWLGGETYGGQEIGNTNPMGAIITHYGLWSGSVEERKYDNRPSGMLEIARGSSHCDYHDSFANILRNIGALNIDYDTLGPNSNSVVRTILEKTSLPVLKPDRFTPGWGTILY
ncbi:hypothetical protein SAMN04488518_1402 [Pseudovibrio ascidiaceicola]|uniref:Uncharacterized protein n=1 Tax=Pseudovibrio ascidiaceicola TaxID=285279 RepID=A0A1I4GAP5_9HYPH|nr:hypothetical protein [Pseudovibrio ascidiaceicola]SFL27112.1 hypothetical protein SAMN04488518_1402 [Pseudovibrio ascidiaceicola]